MAQHLTSWPNMLQNRMLAKSAKAVGSQSNKIAVFLSPPFLIRYGLSSQIRYIQFWFRLVSQRVWGTMSIGFVSKFRAEFRSQNQICSHEAPIREIYANYTYWGGGPLAQSLGCCPDFRPEIGLCIGYVSRLMMDRS